MPSLRFASTAAAALSLAFASTGCGTTLHQPQGAAQLDTEPVAEINDEDVRKAFEARPQLPRSLRVAYYSFDEEKARDVEAMIRALPGVTEAYHIPSLMASGRRRYASSSPWAPPVQPLGIKKLRVLAARAHCDAIVIADHGYRIDRSANALAAFNVLIVPALVLPFLDAKVESYLELHLIDTRNGYLYGQLSAEREFALDFLSIYSDEAETRVGAQWDELTVDVGAALAKLVGEEQARPPAPQDPAAPRERPAGPPVQPAPPPPLPAAPAAAEPVSGTSRPEEH